MRMKRGSASVLKHMISVKNVVRDCIYRKRGKGENEDVTEGISRNGIGRRNTHPSGLLQTELVKGWSGRTRDVVEGEWPSEATKGQTQSNAKKGRMPGDRRWGRQPL